VHERLAAGELEATHTQGLGLADGCLEQLDGQMGIAVTVGVELGRQPTVPAGQVTALGQVKVELPQRIVLCFDDTPPGSRMKDEGR